MEEGRIKRALSKLNEVLGFESPEPVGLIINKEIDPYLSVLEKTKAAIENNPKTSDKSGARWLTTTEISGLLNLPRRTILNHLRNDRFKGRGMGRTFVAQYTDIVDAYGQEFMERGHNTAIKPKWCTESRRNTNHAGTNVLMAGYMTKDRVIEELNAKVSTLTSEVEALRERNLALHEQINKDI